MIDRVDLIAMVKDKTVAVIGNSQSLFNHAYGSEIDSHDIVIRINKAAMLYTRFDAEETHGRKTNVWAVWDINTFDQSSLNKFTGTKAHVGTKNTGPLADYTSPREWIQELRDNGIRNPSSGLILLHILSKSEAKQVDVYGFDWKKTMTFTDNTFKDKHHTFLLEEQYCFYHIFARKNFRYVHMNTKK